MSNSFENKSLEITVDFDKGIGVGKIDTWRYIFHSTFPKMFQFASKMLSNVEQTEAAKLSVATFLEIVLNYEALVSTKQVEDLLLSTLTLKAKHFLDPKLMYSVRKNGILKSFSREKENPSFEMTVGHNIIFDQSYFFLEGIKVLKMSYYENKTIPEISKLLNESRERIYILDKIGLLQLKSVIGFVPQMRKYK